MPEIALADIEKWYITKLNGQYDKHKKALKKLLERLEQLMVNLKQAVNKMMDRKGQVELDENSEKYLDRFYDNVKKNVDMINIPDSPMAEDVTNLIEEIKKLFINMNESGRKNIPKFANEFKIELKEIDMITRKMSEQMAQIDEFLRKKYGEVKEAELLAKRFPKLQTLVDRIITSKQSLDNLSEQAKKLDQDLKSIESQIIEIEQNALYVEKSKYEKQLFDNKLNFDEQLKFKKALIKLKKKLESSGSYKGITPDDVRKYISDPISSIAREGENHPGLSEFLIKLRYLLENENQMLQIKADAKEKMLSNIDQIVSKGLLKPIISDYNRFTEELKRLNYELDKSNLNNKLTDLKDKISIRTQDLEHMDGDIKMRTQEYRTSLEKLKEEREDIQIKIKQYVNEDVKLQITLNL